MKNLATVTLAAALVLLPSISFGQVLPGDRCSGVASDIPQCARYGTGWYIDKTDRTMHYLVLNVDWLELTGSSTTLTLTSNQATTLAFSDNITMAGTLDVTGALGLTAGLTVGTSLTVGTTLAVTGATTLSAALTVGGELTLSPVYTITPTVGAGKAFFGIQKDGTTYDATANALNHIYFADQVLNHTNVVAGGAYLLTADATGLDIGGGTIAENDNAEVFGNMLGASGRPFVVGTDAAFQFCVTVITKDVSGTDAFYCGFREASSVPGAIGSYTDFGAIGHVSGQIGTIDEGGADDCGTDAIADTETDTLCTLVSAAGVVTYTVGGTTPTTPGAQTITDGQSVIPFCNILHDADLAEDTIITSWAVSYQ